MPSLTVPRPLAALFRGAPSLEVAPPAPRPRRTAPLLMGDIVTVHRGETLFLSEWRRAEAERDGEG
jgi:hypothetical protein